MDRYFYTLLLRITHTYQQNSKEETEVNLLTNVLDDFFPPISLSFTNFRIFCASQTVGIDFYI